MMTIVSPDEWSNGRAALVRGTDPVSNKVYVWLDGKEPTGEEVNYSHNKSTTTGACVSRDFTQGYGPEVYTLPRAPEGLYGIEANYYASHQASAATGSTSAVLWSVKNMGVFDQEEFQFASVRLLSHKQRQRVLNITM